MREKAVRPAGRLNRFELSLSVRSLALSGASANRLRNDFVSFLRLGGHSAVGEERLYAPEKRL